MGRDVQDEAASVGARRLRAHMRRVLLALALTIGTHAAWATGVLRQDAGCGMVVAAMDSKDTAAITMVVQFMADALARADEPFVRQRKGSLIEPMSVDELFGAVAYAVVKCRQAPDKLARQAAIEAYAGLRAFSSAFGGPK